MKNLIVLFILAFTSQIAFAQQTTTTAPAAEKKAGCAAGEKSGKACCAAGAAKSGKSCSTDGTASVDAVPATEGQTAGMVKKVAVATALQAARFQVWGNCGMCKKTIEKAAKGVDGVASADWNVDTHQFTVAFDPAKTSAEKVHQAIAAAGYDTDQVRGNDTAYNNLHGCCQYERKK